jgi:hypothetical protein
MLCVAVVARATLVHATEAPYTTKVNYRSPTSRGTTP